MKRKLLLVTTSLMLALVLPACGGNSSNNEETVISTTTGEIESETKKADDGIVLTVDNIEEYMKLSVDVVGDEKSTVALPSYTEGVNWNLNTKVIFTASVKALSDRYDYKDIKIKVKANIEFPIYNWEKLHGWNSKGNNADFYNFEETSKKKEFSCELIIDGTNIIGSGKSASEYVDLYDKNPKNGTDTFEGFYGGGKVSYEILEVSGRMHK